MPKAISKKQFNYLKALNTLDYYFEGMMIPYILLGESAKLIKEQSDLSNLDRLEIGVADKSLSKYSRSLLKMWFGEEWADNEHEIEGIKVYLKLIKRRYGFFKFLDKIPYWGGSFHIANPFSKYWK